MWWCVFIYDMFVIYEEINNRTSCEEEQYTVKNKEILNCDNCLGNGSFYIRIEHDSQHEHDFRQVALRSLHTCCSLVLLQRAPVSPWSRQTAEHSHFTLLNLGHMAFTPVAALSKNPGQTSAAARNCTNLQPHPFNSAVKDKIGNATMCQHATNVHTFITGVKLQHFSEIKCRLTSNLLLLHTFGRGGYILILF